MTNIISFDYAIKYLLRNKADYDIVEGFISALFATEGYPPVKIESLLESESNKERRDLKTSVADLIVNDTDGNKYIIEISRDYTRYFLHKACFNTSRLIVDHLDAGQDYMGIKKIFHINLLYFQMAGITAPLSHGKVIFHTIEKDSPVEIHLRDRSESQALDLHNVFPEYFIISVPLFDNAIKAEIDEWLYAMKNAAVKEDFKSPYMKKVAARLSVLTMPTMDRIAYDSYRHESSKIRDCYLSAEEKGIEKGKIEGKIEVARNLLRQGVDAKTIALATGLSLVEIENIRE